jgi:hypothetical protein
MFGDLSIFKNQTFKNRVNPNRVLDDSCQIAYMFSSLF